VALTLTVTTLPAATGNGAANPADYYGLGALRAGNATAFWEPFAIVGGPQWIPLPYGTTRLGYAFLHGAAASVVEVFGSSPLAFPLSTLPDVSLGSLVDAQVLAYQATSGKWINATPTGGGGGSGGTTDATLIDASTLPLADPLVAGKLWNFGGTCRISMGTVPFTLSYGTLQTYTLTGANVRRSVPLLSGMFQGNQAQLTMLVSQSVSGTAKNVTVYLLYNGVTQAQQTIAMTVDSTAGNDRTFNITFTTSRGAAGTSYPWSVELSSSTAGGPVYSVSGSLNTLLV